MLCSPSRNPVRKQPLEAQIPYYNIPAKKRQLQRMLKRHTKGGGRYLCALVKKTISTKNRQERGQYDNDHIYDPLFGFFDHIVYTDEAYVDPTSQAQEEYFESKGHGIDQRILKKGHRSRASGFILPHGSVGGWGKALKLWFYNDEKDKIERPPLPGKPRRRPTTETNEKYAERLRNRRLRSLITSYQGVSQPARTFDSVDNFTFLAPIKFAFSTWFATTNRSNDSI